MAIPSAAHADSPCALPCVLQRPHPLNSNNEDVTSFGPIANHYDLLMSAVPYRMWAEYLKLLHEIQKVQPHHLLDACCGTGTVAELLTADGYQVTGFDLSEKMIQVAKVKAKGKNLNIDYHVADATALQLPDKYDAAYSFFDSFNYITDLEGFRQAIQGCANHLKPGGSLIFDLNTAYAFEANLFTQKELHKKASIKYDWVGSYDKDSRQIEVKMDFWRDGEHFQEVHKQRAHSDEEVRQALADAGFEEILAFDSYSLGKPRKKSDRIHYAALMGG